MKLAVGDEALADLFAIAEFASQDDPERAAKLVAGLLVACAGLVEHPRLHPYARGHEVRGIRRRSHGRYLIFYRIVGDTVQVLHVLHGARDYDALLFDV